MDHEVGRWENEGCIEVRYAYPNQDIVSKRVNSIEAAEEIISNLKNDVVFTEVKK